MWSRAQIGNRAHEQGCVRPIGKAPLLDERLLDSELVDIYMGEKLLQKLTKFQKIMLLVMLLTGISGGVATFVLAQSNTGSAFNLNSPASFPVDI